MSERQCPECGGGLGLALRPSQPNTYAAPDHTQTVWYVWNTTEAYSLNLTLALGGSAVKIEGGFCFLLEMKAKCVFEAVPAGWIRPVSALFEKNHARLIGADGQAFSPVPTQHNFCCFGRWTSLTSHSDTSSTKTQLSHSKLAPTAGTPDFKTRFLQIFDHPRTSLGPALLIMSLLPSPAPQAP